jgi:hypothetical protein
MRRLAVLLVLLAVALTLARCEADPADPPAAGGPAAPAPAPAPQLQQATCPPDAGNCAAVTGRVLYVEAVDPDGDGDAHYVLAGGSVTAPGITVVDVRVGLRPARLPGRGERVSAAGPVYTGSFGQRQIEATEVFHEP